MEVKISYLIVIIIPSLLYMMEDIFTTKNKIFRKTAIGYLVFITAIRHEFGYDYQVYLKEFNSLQTGSILPFEAGYSLINKIIFEIGLQFNWVLLIVSLINYILLYLVIEREVPRFKWLSMFCFLTYFDLFFYSLSAVRQSIAISIFLYSVKYIRENRTLKYFGTILLASFFHKTALILLPFKFIYNYLEKQSAKKINLFLIISVMSYFFIVKKILEYMKPFLSQRYIYYFFLDDSSKYEFSISTFVIISFIALIFINFTEYNKRKEMNISWIAMYIFFILKILQSIKYYSILPRIQFYFYPFYIILVPLFIDKIKKVKYKCGIIGIIIIFQILFFSYKYESNSKVTHYKEYRTIFTK